jgi:sulfatase maturation enzyme AslB (radical SAM superfamily)
LLNGDQHENCQDCWNEEAAGRQSLRQIHNARFAAVEANPDQPRAIILKPGNLCNLACRHCNPHTSTAWYRDYYRIESQGYASLGEFAQQFNGAKNSYAESNEIWQTLRDWTDDIIFWDLYGAEPMLIKPLIDVLKNASYTAAAAQQSIHINTNGTVWQDDFAELFNRFGSVDIGVSIDGIERQFDYMRYPARWCEIQENLHRYQQLNNASIKVSICITVSLLNVYYLPEYLDYFRSQGWHVGTNLVHGPDHLNMRIADPATKSAILDKLSGHAELDDICKFIQLDWHDAQSDIEKFFDITRSYDRIRGESYTEVFPEFAKILEQSHAGCWQ